MFRAVRLMMMVFLPAIVVGVPLGMALGSYAKGETLHAVYSGNMLPEQGATLRSATSADAIQPAAVAYTPQDRYAGAAAHRID